jgi:cation/acetate symporter
MRPDRRFAIVVALFLASGGESLLAQTADAGVARQPAHLAVVAAFFATAFIVLLSARWAAERAHAFLHAHAEISDPNGGWHGFSLSGAHLSAAALLGLPALMLTGGDAAFIWATGLLAGWPLLALLLARKLHNLGMLTFADVLVWRLQGTALRVLAAIGALLLTLLYLTAQIIGAGQLFGALFGLEYWLAVVIVGSLMMATALHCGRVAFTWLAIVKAIVLLLLLTLLAAMSLWIFGVSAATATSEARPFVAASSAGLLLTRTPVEYASLGLTLFFGLSGLPHLLMRFTAASARSARIARQGGLWASVWTGVFVGLLLLIWLGLTHLPEKASIMQNLSLRDNSNLALLYLAEYLAEYMGDGVLMGATAAVLLIALLTVSVGLGHAAAAAVAHDIYACVLRREQVGKARELEFARLGIAFLFLFAMLLGILLAGQSVLFPVALALALAASVHAPILLLSLFWKGCTRRGALIGGAGGLISALALMLFSPPIWVNALGHAVAPFPYALPTLFSMSFAFLLTWLFSLADRGARAQQERADWSRQQSRAETGL